MVLWFYVQERLKAQPAVVLVINISEDTQLKVSSDRLLSQGSNSGPLDTR